MANKLYDNIIANMGFRNTPEFIIKYILPWMAGIVAVFLVLLLLIPGLDWYYSFGALAFGTVVLLGYPYMIFEKRRVAIEENLHLFITFAGTVSTVDITSGMLFKKIAERDNLGEISQVGEKVLYFARKWNLGFAKTARIVASMSPSRVFGDFLDRFAVMLDYGQSIEVFLVDEQESVMDDYAANYRKALENIKTVQDIFVSLTMALGFMLAISLLLPLISGTSIEIIVQYALLAMILIDVGILVFVNSFIPSDKLCYRGPIVDPDTQELYKWVYACFPLSLFLIIFAFWLDIFTFITNIGIGLIPLFAVGLKSQLVETSIVKREKSFPSFIRAFGTAIEVKGGAVDAAIMSLRVHDFGSMNRPLIDLYRRLKTGNDKYPSWEYFASAPGSNVIYAFISIFSESVFLGGSAEKIGEMMSRNFQKILSLRKLRMQLGSGFRGAMYGALVGFAAAAYVSATITRVLGDIFSGPLQNQLQGDGFEALAGTIGPLTSGVDMQLISTYIAIMIIFHSVISSGVIKVVDGGSMYSAFFDIVIMVWIGVAVSIVVPWGIEALLPGFGNIAGGFG